MLFDMETLEAQSRYKILTATVTPRPIAWVTTLSEDGVINAAPYSFFNVLGHEPPTLALGLLAGKDRFKDTATNILATGEFVVNLVSEANADAMNVTCIDAPPDIDELALAGLNRPLSRGAAAAHCTIAGFLRVPRPDLDGDGTAPDHRDRPHRLRPC